MKTKEYKIAGILIVYCFLINIHSGVLAQITDKKNIVGIEGSLGIEKIDFVDHLGYYDNATPRASEEFQFTYAYKLQPNTVLEAGLGKKYYGPMVSFNPLVFSAGLSQFYKLNQDKIRLFIRQRIYTCMNTSYRTDRSIIYLVDTFDRGSYVLQRSVGSNSDFRPIFILYQISSGLNFRIVENHHLNLFLSYSFGFQTIARETIEYTVLRNGTKENGIATYTSKGTFSALGISYQYHF
jgi:hypothetical protein